MGDREKTVIRIAREIFSDPRVGSWHKKCPDTGAHLGLGTSRMYLRSITGQIIQGKKLTDKQYLTIEDIGNRYEIIKKVDQEHPEGTQEEAITLIEEIINMTDGKTNTRSTATHKGTARDSLIHLKNGDYLQSRSLYQAICIAEAATYIKGTDLERKITQMRNEIRERENKVQRELYPFGQGGR